MPSFALALRATLHLTLPWAILLPLYGWVFLVPFVLFGSRAATRTRLWATGPEGSSPPVAAHLG